MTLDKEHGRFTGPVFVSGETVASIQRAVKHRFFFLRNYFYFYLLLFNPVAKNLVLRRKNTRGAFPPPPCTHPIDASDYVNKNYIFVFIYLDFFPVMSSSYIKIRNFLKYSYILKHVASPRFSTFFK